MMGALHVNVVLGLIVGSLFVCGIYNLFLRQRIRRGCTLIGVAVAIFTTWHYIVQAAIYIALLNIMGELQ